MESDGTPGNSLSMARSLRSLTREPNISDDNDVDRRASLEDALQTAQRLLREVVHRQLRYEPRCTGEVTVKLAFRDGIPFRISEEINASQYFGPVLKQSDNT